MIEWCPSTIHNDKIIPSKIKKTFRGYETYRILPIGYGSVFHPRGKYADQAPGLNPLDGMISTLLELAFSKSLHRGDYVQAVYLAWKGGGRTPARRSHLCP